MSLPGGGAELAGPNPTVVALPFRHRPTGFTKRTAIWRLTRLRVGKFPASFESARRGRASAWPIFDNDLLTEPLRQPLPHNPGYSVSTAARRKPNDPPQRPRWKGLRPCNPRHHWQRGGTRGQMQECAAGKFQHHSITSSARASRVGGTSRPNVLAISALMTSSDISSLVELLTPTVRAALA